MLTGFFMLFDVYLMLMKVLYHISLWAGSLGWDFMHVSTTICKLFCVFGYFFIFTNTNNYYIFKERFNNNNTKEY